MAWLHVLGSSRPCSTFKFKLVVLELLGLSLWVVTLGSSHLDRGLILTGRPKSDSLFKMRVGNTLDLVVQTMA